ncbi:FecCD family ABC transporter permease [Microlunatus flavus]|uniref:Iron complex transport system permease protein n=1 Tax=Microlunatus flavus TaxID=1036181 RepID=A0A1H9ANB4_9ACTN|nr:iron chelate uptake ABC transporter family permease subunit [Microlunatus flavus]SEP77957.1 iron complex transport system permease protein [Microlunatus flavus]
MTTFAPAARGTLAARVGTPSVRRVRRHARTRTATVCVGLVVALAVASGVALSLGDYPLPLAELLATLTGQGTTASNFIVLGLRLPRVLTGILVGACFGLSGTTFQCLLRNPLASPDIIGISYGASAGGVLAILLLGWSGLLVSGAALGGALLAATLIYAVAYRGGLSGYRFVLVGVGVSALMVAVVNYLMTRAEVFEAQAALVWLTGSLNGASAGQLRTLALACLVLVPLLLLAGRTLLVLQLGDDVAASVGLRVEAARLAVIALAVVLAAVATAAAGPVGFVAFVAGPVAKRLTGGSGPSLVPAALVGALVVVVSDVAGQHLLPFQLPVGVVTAAVGAPYLLYLLIRSNRAGVGG